MCIQAFCTDKDLKEGKFDSKKLKSVFYTGVKKAAKKCTEPDGAVPFYLNLEEPLMGKSFLFLFGKIQKWRNHAKEQVSATPTKAARGLLYIEKDESNAHVLQLMVVKGKVPILQLSKALRKLAAATKVKVEYVGGTFDEKLLDAAEQRTEAMPDEPELSPEELNDTGEEEQTEQETPSQTANPNQVPKTWPFKSFIGFSSVGTDVHYLRVRLNQLLQGKIKPLPYTEPIEKSIFNKEDALAVVEFQKRAQILRGAKTDDGKNAGTATGLTLELLTHMDSLEEPGAENGEPNPKYPREIPKEWYQIKTFTWGMTGTDIYFLRLRLNQVLYGRITPLPLNMPPDKVRFSKLESDAILKFQEIQKLLRPGWKVEGGGQPGTATGETLRRLHSPDSNPKPEFIELLKNSQPLQEGKMADKGQYDPSKGFEDKAMQSVLEYYCKEMGIKWQDISGESADEGKASGGDMNTGDVAGYPAWYNAFQAKLVDSTSWGKEEQTLNALMNAYLRDKYRKELGVEKLPANIEIFFQHIGKSEANKRCEDLAPNTIGSDNWCAMASNYPVVQALHQAGLRFKQPNQWAKGNQLGLYTAWSNKNTIPAPKSFAHTDIQPGDILSYVSSATPLSGHVATVLTVKGDLIHVVSGNAGSRTQGNGTIRINDVQREIPPTDFNYNESLKIEKQEKELAKKLKDINRKLDQLYAFQGEFEVLRVTHQEAESANMKAIQAKEKKYDEVYNKLMAIKNPLLQEQAELNERKKKATLKPKPTKGTPKVWITAIQKTAQLDPAQLAKLSDKELDKMGLERVVNG